MSEVGQANVDAQMAETERMIGSMFDANYNPTGLTQYEINKQAETQGAPTPDYGPIGPPKPDYILQRETADDMKKRMPGSTAAYHYDDQGNYTLGQVPAKEEKQKTNTGLGKWWKNLSHEQKAGMMLTGLSTINAAAEKRIANQRQDQLDQNIWERQMSTAGRTDKGMYLPNSGVPVPPTMQNPVQFSGYNPFGYASAKQGKEVKTSDIAYLTDDEIKAIIQMGGQVEFLD